MSATLAPPVVTTSPRSQSRADALARPAAAGHASGGRPARGQGASGAGLGQVSQDRLAGAPPQLARTAPQQAAGGSR